MAEEETVTNEEVTVTQPDSPAASGAGDEAVVAPAAHATAAAQAEAGSGAGTAQAAAAEAQATRTAAQENEQAASRSTMRTVQDMQGMEMLMFLFMLLLGIGGDETGLGSDEALRGLANAFGADGDEFINTVRSYQRGDSTISEAATRLNRSVNVDTADLEEARAVIREYGGDDNPLLGLIARSEHKGNYDEENGNYNIVYGGREVPLTTMTINEVIAWQQNFTNNGSPSSAAGQYQIIRTTLTGLRDEMGLTGNELFDPEMQDRMGYQLLMRRGYDDYLAGEIDDATFMRNLSMEWASFPKDENGLSYYAGDGLNNALTNPASVLAAMQLAREDNLNPDRPGAFAGDPSIRERFDVNLASLGGAGMEIAGRGTNNAQNRAHMTRVHEEAVARSPVYADVIDEVSAEFPHLAPHLHRFEVDGRLVIDREYAARLDGFMGEIEAHGGTITSNDYNMVNVLDYRLENGGRTNGVLLNTPHLVGRAWDGKAEGVDPSIVAAAAERYGLGTVTPRQYQERGSSFTHLDLSMNDRRFAAAYSDPMVNEQTLATASAGPIGAGNDGDTATATAFAEAKTTERPLQTDPAQPAPLVTSFGNGEGTDQVAAVQAAVEQAQAIAMAMMGMPVPPSPDQTRT